MNIPNLAKPGDLLPLRRNLVRRMRERAGSGSWRGFFDNYWRFIYAAARRAGLTEAEALTAVEETIVAASTQWSGSAVRCEEGAFKSWLMELTRWRILEQLASRPWGGDDPTLARGKGGEAPASPHQWKLGPSGAENFWDEEWQRNLFAVAVERVQARVNSRQFQMFDLHVLRRWPLSKVTVALGVNIGQVYLAKHRLTALLRKEIRAMERG